MTEKKQPKHDQESIENRSDSDDTLKELVEKNIKWSQVIYEQDKKIKRRLTIMVVFGYLKLCIILAPIILGIIYLPPLIEDFNEKYGAFYSSDSSIPLEELGTMFQQFFDPARGGMEEGSPAGR